jgi:hypothetical protein
MIRKNWISGLLFSVAALALFAAPTSAQQPQSQQPVHYNSDWSDRCVVFTGSSNIQSKINNVYSPRYQRQLLRRNAPAVGLPGYKDPGKGDSNTGAASQGNAGGGDSADDSAPDFDGAVMALGLKAKRGGGFPPLKLKKPPTPQGDWNLSLSTANSPPTAPVAAGQFPAKFTFDINATPSCTNDYVIVGEDAAGANPTPATYSGAESPDGKHTAAGNTFTIGSVTFTAVASGATGTEFNVGTTGTTSMANLATAINIPANSAAAGVTASSSGDTLTLTANTPGAAANSIGVSESGIDHYSSDYTSMVNGADGQPSIVGLNNLYAGSPTTASVTGTFAGSAGTSGSVTITNGANNLTLSPGTASTASIPFTHGSRPTSGSTVTIGGVTYTFVALSGTCTQNQIEQGTSSSSDTTAIANLVKVLNGTGTSGTSTSDTYCSNGTTTTPNTAASGATATDAVTLTNTIPGSAQNGITAFTSSSSYFGSATATWAGGAGGAGFVSSANTTNEATALAAAIAANGATVGVTATSSGAEVTVTATTAGAAGNNITVAGTVSNFSWNYGSLTGGADSGLCNSSGPTVVWSYITGAGGVVATSPILSSDGSKVAFIESVTGTGSYLRVIRMATATAGGSPATDGTTIAPTSLATTNTGWGSGSGLCPLTGTTACMVSFLYSASTNTTSSPYYDYTPGADALYVGDSAGALWKITGVFTGTPTNAWASGITIAGATGGLTGPALDPATHNVFVGDGGGGMSYVRDTGSTEGSCTIPCFGARTTGHVSPVLTSMADPPILDSSNGYVTFFGQSGSGARVKQFSTTASSPLSTNEVSVNVGTNTTNPIRTGMFNSGYYTAGTGTMYVCGNNNSTAPELYALSFSSGLITSSTPTTLFSLGSSSGQCSPLSEIPNGSQDWLFVGVPGTCSTFGVFGAITTGCIESFDVTSTLTSSSTAVAEGGTTGTLVGSSGIVVDNVSASGHASSLYYGTQTAATCTTQAGGSSSGAGCLVQRTQSGLQ